MKKLVFVFIIVAITSIFSAKCHAYWSAYLESPQWPEEYQTTVEYAAGGNYIYYHLYVDGGACYIGTNGGLNDQLCTYEQEVLEKWGYYEGSWTIVVMTTCNLQNESAFARVEAYL